MSERLPYAGVVSRATALAIDCVISHAIFIVTAAVLGLVASLAGGLRPEWLAALLAGAGWVLIEATYFAGSWALTGQTPGMRLMHLRVVAGDGAPPHAGRSLVRLVGLVLAIVPLFAGFLPVLFDRRRRALPDLMAGTLVVYADRALTAADLEDEAAGSLVADDLSGQPL
jgi:uncharacterized RDD family membrane protein YckC